MAESKKKKPINDVTHADETAPEPSSRPILVTNRPIIKDPMMVEGDKATGETNEDAVQVKVQRHSELKLPTTAAPEPATEKPAAQPDTPPPEEAKPEPASEPAKPEAAAPEPSKDPEAENGEADKDDTPDATAIDEAEASKQAEHDAEIQKMADSKQYFLPINAVEKRKSQRFVLLGIVLSLVLALAWADIALDAGIIASGTNLPHTHLFDQQPVAAPAASTALALTSKTYKAPVSKLTFHYPASWQFSSAGSTAALDDVIMSPKGSGDIQADTAAGFISVFLNSSPPASTQNSSDTSTIKYVHYQKSTHLAQGVIYLRDIIFQTAGGNINLSSALSDKNDQQVGDKLTNAGQTFTNADGKQVAFAIIVIKNAPGSTGFSSIQDAQQFLHSSDYQAARSILLSMSVTKS